MARWAVAARNFATGHAVLDVPPVVGRDIARVDASRLDRIDQAEDLRDLRPAMNAEQDISARINLRHGCARFVSIDGADDVERRADGAVFVGSPADQSEHLARRIAFDALAAADNPVRYWLAELRASPRVHP